MGRTNYRQIALPLRPKRTKLEKGAEPLSTEHRCEEEKNEEKKRKIKLASILTMCTIFGFDFSTFIMS